MRFTADISLLTNSVKSYKLVVYKPETHMTNSLLREKERL